MHTMILLRTLIFFLLAIVFSSCTTFSRSPSEKTYLLVQSGRFDDAIEYATKRLRKDTDPELLYYRGCAAFSRGDFESARADLSAAEHAYRDDHFFYFNKGQVLMMGAEYQAARAAFLRSQELIRRDEVPAGMKPLALVLPQSDDIFPPCYYAGIHTRERFLAYMYYLVGLSYEREGTKDKFAMKQYTLAVDTDKRFLPALYRRARLYSQYGAAMVALDDASRVLAEFTHSEAFVLRAAIYGMLKKWSAARDDYTAAIARDPDNAALYGARAAVYDVLGDTERAATDRQKMREIQSRK